MATAKDAKKTILDGEGNEHQYYVIQWPAEKQFLMKIKLVKVIGPSIAELAAGFGKDNNDAAQAEALANGLAKLFDGNNPEQIMDLFMEVVGNAKRDGERVSDTGKFNEFYQDNLLEAYKAFAFVLETNYKGFFKGKLADKLQTLAAVTQ